MFDTDKYVIDIFLGNFSVVWISRDLDLVRAVIGNLLSLLAP